MIHKPLLSGLRFFQSMTVLETTTAALELAKELIQAGALPAKAGYPLLVSRCTLIGSSNTSGSNPLNGGWQGRTQ